MWHGFYFLVVLPFTRPRSLYIRCSDLLQNTKDLLGITIAAFGINDMQQSSRKWIKTHKRLALQPPNGGREFLMSLPPSVWNLRAFTCIPFCISPLLFFCLVLLLFLCYPFYSLVHSPDLFFPKPTFSLVCGSSFFERLGDEYLVGGICAAYAAVWHWY